VALAPPIRSAKAMLSRGDLDEEACLLVDFTNAAADHWTA